jgi:hypothetical protein
VRHVLVVDVDVDEAVQRTFLDQALFETTVSRFEVVDEFGQRGAAALDGLFTIGVGTKDGRDGDGDGHN